MKTKSISRRVELVEAPGNTILLGPEIGAAALDNGRRLSIVGSGKTLRFILIQNGKNSKQYDLDLTPLAQAVVES